MLFKAKKRKSKTVTDDGEKKNAAATPAAMNNCWLRSGGFLNVFATILWIVALVFCCVAKPPVQPIVTIRSLAAQSGNEDEVILTPQVFVRQKAETPKKRGEMPRPLMRKPMTARSGKALVATGLAMILMMIQRTMLEFRSLLTRKYSVVEFWSWAVLFSFFTLSLGY